MGEILNSNVRPRVSIVTMVLNGAEYLETCIQSVLRQTYPNIEHVFVDGVSTDGSVEMLAGYASQYPERIRFISEPDRGAGDAWNKGVKLATGDILGWIGSDDFYEPGAIESVVAFFQTHPDACFVYGGLNHIDEAGTITGTSGNRDVILDELINEYCVVPTPAAFYKPSVFEAVGTFDDLGNDLDFFIRVAKRFPMYRLDPILSNFRVHYEGDARASMYLKMKREDCMLSRRHGGRFMTGYCRRYYRMLLLTRLRGLLGPAWPLVKSTLKRRSESAVR
jgi:glycosyltransferase involved in cell wall biosynthesis